MRYHQTHATVHEISQLLPQLANNDVDQYYSAGFVFIINFKIRYQ